MKRWGRFLTLAVTSATLTGCPIPPPGYSPPRVDSVQVSPQPAHPGDTVTILIEASDDQGIASGVPNLFTTPSGTRLNALGVCTSERTPHDDDPTNALLTVTCPVPTYASNGTWHVNVHINDGAPLDNYPGTDAQIPFVVTGGSDDYQAPQLVSYNTEPAVVDQTTTFTLAVRLSDESLPLRIGYEGNGSFQFTKIFDPASRFSCGDPTITPVTATVVDIVVACVPSYSSTLGRAAVGLHRTFMGVEDVLGHEGTVEMYVDVQPAPAI